MKNNQNNSDNKNSFDVREFIESCKAHWKWYAIAVAVAAILGCYMYLKSYTTYDVSTKILMYDDAANAGGMSLVKQFSIGGLIGGSGAVDDEIKVLQSHSIMAQTAKQLKLNVGYKVRKGLLRNVPVYDDDVPVVLQYDREIVDTLSVVISFKVKVADDGKTDIVAKVKRREIGRISDTTLPATVTTDYGNFTFVPTNVLKKGKSLKETVTLSSFDAAAERYLKLVSVSIPDKKSSMIALSFTTPDQEFGKALLDTIIANYNIRGIEERRQRDLKTAQLIDQRLMALTGDLAQSEASIEDFQKSSKVIDVATQAQQITQKLIELKNTIEVAQTELDLIDMTRKFLSNPQNKYDLIPFGSGVSVGAYNTMIGTYNSKIMERMQLSNGAKNNNATMRAFDEQLDAMRANILLTLDKAYDTARFKYDELLANQQKYESMLASMPSQIRDYRGIQRLMQIKEQLYLYLLQQREETAMTLENGQPRAVIVDKAYTHDDPHKFGKMQLLMIIFFIGFVIPTGLVFLNEQLRGTISRRSSLARLTAVPVLGEVERNPKNDSVMIVEEGASPASIEYFRILRNNLLFILPDSNEKVVMVTSVKAGGDAPFVAVNLAAVLALLGKKVVLVDMDVRCPSLENVFGLSGKPGLTDYLSDDRISLPSIISTVDGAASFDVISSGKSAINSSELLAGSRADSMIEKLRDDYDYVVILSSPFAEVADSYSVARFVDATIVSVKAEKTEIKDFERINEASADERFPKLSIVRVNDPAGKKGEKIYGA